MLRTAVEAQAFSLDALCTFSGRLGAFHRSVGWIVAKLAATSVSCGSHLSELVSFRLLLILSTCCSLGLSSFHDGDFFLYRLLELVEGPLALAVVASHVPADGGTDFVQQTAD